jgi:deoxyribodipyrimidine photolyase-related protein
MKTFRQALAAAAVSDKDGGARRWVYVPYDQVGLFGALDAPAAGLGIVMVEDPGKGARRPYHKQKLAFVLANSRHFALEAARRGVAVDYRVAPPGTAAETGLVAALRAAADAHGPLDVMRPAERELRVEIAPLLDDGALREVPHAGWLTTAEGFRAACPRAPYRLDAFYRHARAARGVLMDGDGPLGGRWSFDADNRLPWRGPARGDPPAPAPLRFTPDAVTEEVGALVRARFGHHPGDLDLAALPTTHADAEAAWAWALAHALPHFGPYEDAMSTASDGLFHARIAHLLNVHRLLPARVVADVAARTDLPLASVEGFIRQVLGWREFVRHVHNATDGFRTLPAVPPTRVVVRPAVAPAPGDAGWRASQPGYDPAEAPPPALPAGLDGGALPAALGDTLPLPAAYWGRPSGLNCLDHVVTQVMHDGWTHHIPRLMVLGNIGALLGVSPRALTDWFWCAFIDAYDWVVEPNVLAMGTFGVGEVMTTKPYVAGSAYVDRMSDLCGGCAFVPGKTCPLTPLYWAFLRRHADTLASNPRVAGPVANARRRPDGARDDATFDAVRARLDAGEPLTPAALHADIARRVAAADADAPDGSRRS